MLEIADSREGLTVQQVSERLGVHRSIAYRLLQTLADFGLASRTPDGHYAPGARLATLAEAYLPTLRDIARPVMRSLADGIQSTISLFVEQGDEAVAIAMVTPTTAAHHLAFRPGMRTPLTRGAAGYALLAAHPPRDGEPAEVSAARERGFATSHAEVEEGQFAVAAWLPSAGTGSAACLTLITYRADVAEGAGPEIRQAADELDAALRASGEYRA